MRIFTIFAIIGGLPLTFTLYGLYNPSGISWLYIIIPFIIGVVGCIISLYKYWMFGSQKRQIIEEI